MGKVGRKGNEKKPELFYIYTVYKGVVYSTQVRKTNKRYIAVERTGLPFGCRTSFTEEEITFSEKDALEKAIKENEQLQSSARHTLERLILDKEVLDNLFYAKVGETHWKI